jgi:hypothetical protein
VKRLGYTSLASLRADSPAEGVVSVETIARTRLGVLVALALSVTILELAVVLSAELAGEAEPRLTRGWFLIPSEKMYLGMKGA